MKKALLMFFVILLVICTPLGVTAKETAKLGDANKDGVISIKDATHIQLYLVDKVAESNIDLKLSDVDGDSRLSIVDATYIQLFLAARIDKFPGEKEPVSPPSIDPDGYYDQIVRP